MLVFTNQVPGHDLGERTSGHVQYLNGFLDHFRERGFEVVMVVFRPNVDFVWRSAREDPFTIMGPAFASIFGRVVHRSLPGIGRLVAWHIYSRLPHAAQVAGDGLRLALRKRRGFSHRLGAFPSAQEIAYARGAVNVLAPDIIIYDGIFNSCGRLSSTAQHWIITHDVKHQRAASFRRNGVSVVPASFDESTERTILEQSGNVIAIQWDDAREFTRLAPAARVLVVPNTTTLPTLVRRDRVDGARCLFVGSASYHNYHGIRWFLDECWPRIHQVVPNATLDIVGNVCFRLANVPPGVTLHGMVDALDPFYARSAVTIVPLQIGSGLKIKLVEALARDQAIVTTSVGAQGLTDFSPAPFVIADTSAAFAHAIVELVGSAEAQARLRNAARDCARVFDPKTAFAELDAAMAEPRHLGERAAAV
jgi:glycosyltransferase involved in cell wall biosynthesis